MLSKFIRHSLKLELKCGWYEAQIVAKKASKDVIEKIQRIESFDVEENSIL